MSDQRPAITDNRCKDCRRGHYDMGDGVLSNFPCTTDGCDCWVCGPVHTPMQARARAQLGGPVECSDPECLRREGHSGDHFNGGSWWANSGSHRDGAS